MSDDLSDVFAAAMREPRLILRLDRNMLDGQPLIHLLKPGATERSKPVKITPVIVGGQEGQETHSAMLRHLATALEQAGR